MSSGDETKSEPAVECSKLSETYGCPEESCSLTVGLVLPNSKYADQTALTTRDLAEKVAIATCSQMTEKEKEDAFKKADDILARPEKVKITNEVFKSTWNAVLTKCPHQARAFKEMIGKSLDGQEVENIDLVLEMIAHLNNAHFMYVKNMDTVVVGAENALKIKNAINANFWGMHFADDSVLRGRVVFGSKIKQIVYVPNEKLFFEPGSQFDAATGIVLQTLDTLQQCNSCPIFMLPIFRHLDHPEVSQQFINWYKETAKKDSRLVGMKELDEMKLINWLNATPSNKDGTEYVNHKGILTERGTRKLVDYLNLLGYKWKHRELQDPTAENSRPSETHARLINEVSLKSLSTSNDQEMFSARATSNFGKEFNRGERTSSSIRESNRDRGVKRRGDEWMNASSRGSTHFNRPRHTHQ